MAELYPSDADLVARSGCADSRQDVLFPAIGESPYYLSFYKMLYRLLDVAQLAGQMRVYKDGPLSFGVRAGSFTDGGGVHTFAGATAQGLADNSANSIYLLSDATLHVSAAGFPDPATQPHVPLAVITTASGGYGQESIADCRARSAFGLLSGMSSAQRNELIGGGATSLHHHDVPNGSIAASKLASDVTTLIQTVTGNSGGVGLVNQMGLTSWYPIASDTDAARGDALRSVLAAAAAGQEVHIGPGTYNVGDHPMAHAAGITISGRGMDSTVIQSLKMSTSTAGRGVCLPIMSDGRYRDFTLSAGNAVSTDPHSYLPMGTSNINSATQAAFTNARVERVRTFGGSDSLYIKQNGCSADFLDCVIEAEFDGLIVGGNSHDLRFRRCQFRVHRHASATDVHAALYANGLICRAFVLQSSDGLDTPLSRLRFYGCDFEAINDIVNTEDWNDVPGFSADAACISPGESPSIHQATIEIYGGTLMSFVASSGDATARERQIYTDGMPGGSVTLFGTYFDPTKVTDTANKLRIVQYPADI